MTHNIWIYIACMAITSFIIRALPLTLIRKPITNTTTRSFLYYVPYVTLSIMTFPAILHATQSVISGFVTLLLGIILAWRGYSLFQVSISCCVIVLLIEIFV